MRDPLILALCVVTAVAMPSSAKAQESDSTTDLVAPAVAALRHARSDLLKPGRRYVLDLSQIDRKHRWDAGQARSLSMVLAKVGEAATAVKHCEGRTGRCTPDALTELLTLSAPVTYGDSAFVDIEVQRTTLSKRTPVALRGHRYTLVRTHGRWVVVRAELISAS